MPFTPFHSGPGLAAKAAIPRHFSICVFILTQIVIDFEVLWHLIRCDPILHGSWHTYLGATIIATVTFIIGKPASEYVKKTWNWIARHCADVGLTVPGPTTWLASFTGAFFGAYSHILLDSIFHPDMQPMWPWSSENPLFGMMDPMHIHVLCVILGVAGLVGYIVRERQRRKASHNVSFQSARHPPRGRR